VSTEILQPFSLTRSGAIATTIDPALQAEQHIDMLVVTAPGERVMLSNYGVGAAGLVFTPDDGELADHVAAEVQAQMALWEPSIVFRGVSNIIDHPSEGRVSISSMLSVTNTATILVGGTVLEVVQ
jgi:phage baseplate assembly protein W